MNRATCILSAMVIFLLASAYHAVAREKLALTLSAVKDNGDGIHLRLTLENEGNADVRVLVPAFWQGGRFRPDTLIGGYSLHFYGADSKPAAIDWGTPNPSAHPHPPRVEESLVLRPGMSVGMPVRLPNDAIDFSCVSRIVAVYDIHTQPADAGARGWGEIKPQLWLGKITSKPFILSESNVPDLGVDIAGRKYPLLFEGPELTDAQKRLLIMDWEYLLATVKKPVFLKMETLPGELVVQKTRGFEHAVTHVLQLADSQRRWLPPILKQRLGPAVEIKGRCHLVIHRRVAEAYKNILSQNQPWEDMPKKLDAFMTALLDPAKRKTIANDPQKARDMFFFYKMAPWEDEQMLRKVLMLMDDDADDVTMRRPSPLEFKTMDKLLYVKDPDVAEIPACFALSLVGDHQPYIERWPPLVYVDGKWCILIFPMP